MHLTITNLIGGLLIAAGIALVLLQMLKKGHGQAAPRGLNARFGKAKLSLSTTFPGLIAIGLGVFLVVVSALTDR